MNCHTVQINLVPYIEGGLGPGEARQVEAHLGRCRSCAQEKARLESVVRPLAGMGRPEIDERRFMSMVREKAASRRKRAHRLAGLAVGFAACLLAAGGAVGVVALYRTSSPVLPEGGRRAWDGRTAQAPSVIWNPDEQLYQMWYDGRGHDSGLAAIGYATSKDGAYWTKYKGNPVIPADARWPCVLYEPDDPVAPYKIWFNTGRGVMIRYARSVDGITWTDMRTVLGRGNAGSYDDADVAAPRVVKVGDEYWMYYSAGTSAIRPSSYLRWGHYIALATSRDGVNWTKRQTVLSRGAPGEWDHTRVFNPAVIHADGLFEMWYVGGDGKTDVPPRTIGYASSTDGIHWTKSRRNPVITGGGDSAYDYAVTAPGVLKVEDGYKVWFTSLTKHAFRWSGVQVGYAEYPLGAWSEDGQAPAAASPPP